MATIEQYFHPLYHMLGCREWSLGVEMHADAAVVVALRRTRKGISVRDARRLLLGDGIHLVEALRDYLEAERLSAPEIVIALPGDAALLKVVHLPGVTAETLPDYLATNGERIIPAYLNAADVSVKSEILSADASGLSMALWIYRPDTLAQQYRRHYCDYHPLRLEYHAAVHGAVVNALHPGFHGAIFQGDTNGIRAFVYREGRWCDLYNLTGSLSTNAEDIAEIVRMCHENSAPRKTLQYWIWGNSAAFEALTAALNDAGWQAIEDKELPQADFQHARALAITALYHERLPGDFLPVAERAWRDEARFRRLTRRSWQWGGLAVAGLLLVFILCQSLLQWRFDHRASEQLQLLPLQVQRDSLQTTRATLAASLKRYRQLGGEASQIAYYLYKLGTALPEEAWYYKVSIEEDAEGEIVIRLSGLARQENEVARWLSALEKLPFAHTIVLDEMTTHNAKEARRKWKMKIRKIVEFRAHLYVAV